MGLQDRDYYNDQVAKQRRESLGNQQPKLTAKKTEFSKLLEKSESRTRNRNLVRIGLVIATITVSFNQLTPQELLQWHKNDLPKIKSSISHTVKKTTDFLKSLT